MIVGRDSAKLKAAAEELGNTDGRLKIMPGDVSREGNASKLVGEALKAFGRLDILVNNAGVFRGGSLIDMEEEDFDYVVDINLKGAWFMCKFACRAMRDTGGGAIVNVSSFLAVRGAKGLPSSAYSAAKAGLLGLTKALAVELAPYQIRVNAVLPAVVRTPILNYLADSAQVEKLLEQWKKVHPLGRVGEAEDVARAIVFLARPENNWLTGVELPVDGGRAAW
jgi:NAD(P)-dependent dehydrogenase (short-subunit alcohol dehydrogenase family)